MSSNSSGAVASSTSSEALALLQQQPKTKKPKKLLKRDDPELKAAKQAHDKILADLQQRFSFLCVEIKYNSIRPNSVQAYKGGGHSWGNLKITIKKAGELLLLIVEAALAHDYASLVNWILSRSTTKLAKLESLLNEPPGLIDANATSRTNYPEPFLSFCDSTRTGGSRGCPLNFMNPSNVDKKWKKEVKARGLTEERGDEFTFARKREIFDAVVREVVKKLMKKNS